MTGVSEWPAVQRPALALLIAGKPNHSHTSLTSTGVIIFRVQDTREGKTDLHFFVREKGVGYRLTVIRTVRRERDEAPLYGFDPVRVYDRNYLDWKVCYLDIRQCVWLLDQDTWPPGWERLTQ